MDINVVGAYQSYSRFKFIPGLKYLSISRIMFRFYKFIIIKRIEFGCLYIAIKYMLKHFYTRVVYTHKLKAILDLYNY
jgi:hypothetical protein